MKTRFVFVCLGLLLGRLTFAEDRVFSARIPASLANDNATLLANQIDLTFHTRKAEAVHDYFSSVLGYETEKIDEGSFRLSINRNMVLSGKPESSDTLSSFVIDFDQESSQDFVQKYADQTGGNRSASKIEPFVSKFIEYPDYAIGFEFMSQVAKRRRGDCTEYAALTTGLSRAMGVPARYIFGLVIISSNDQVQGFGHAWTEQWADNKWEILDAALYGNEFDALYYIPISKLQNEGAGYMLNQLEIIDKFPTELSAIAGIN